MVERAGAGWLERELRGGEVVTLADPAASFAVDDVFDGIALEPVRRRVRESAATRAAPWRDMGPLGRRFC